MAKKVEKAKAKKVVKPKKAKKVVEIPKKKSGIFNEQGAEME